MYYTNERGERDDTLATRARESSRAQRGRRRTPFRAVGQGSWRSAPRWWGGPIVLHMRLDQVASSKSRAKRKLTGQDSRRDDAGQPPGVFAGASRVRTTDTQHVEHGCLRLENRTAAQGANFERRHRDGDLQGSTEAIHELAKLVCSSRPPNVTHFFMMVMQLALSTTCAGS